MIEIFTQSNQVGHCAHRQGPLFGLGRQQIGDTVSVAFEPILRQCCDPAALEGDHRVAQLPGAQYVAGRGDEVHIF